MSAELGSVNDAGPLLAGRYRVVRELGSGGFGSVWEAIDEKSRERVAVKELQRMDAASLYRFKQEFRSLADTVHPNLVGLRELHGADDAWFLTMTLVHGVDFLSYVRARAAPPLEVTVQARPRVARPRADPSADTIDVSSLPTLPEVRGWRPERAPDDGPLASFAADEARLVASLRQLVAGVTALHGAGKLHCDLKPTNVLVRDDGALVILDFGLVADARGAALGDLGLAGTPSHMSPEQARGAELTPASDWYAVGVMLFEALTGRLPHVGGPADVLRAKALADGPDPRLFCAGVPDALAELCVALTRRDPRARAGAAEILALVDPEAPPRSLRVAHQADDVPAELAALGREPHLAALREARALRTASRAAVVAHVHGAAGLGKTTLLARFRAELAASGEVVLEGRCYERESVPFNAFDSLIDALAGYLRRLPDAELGVLVTPQVGALARLFPVLRNVPAIAVEASRGADAAELSEQRLRGSRALRALLGAVAEQRPLTLCIDDLQWGDADSALLLADLLAAPGAPPILWLVSYRTEARASSPILAALPRPGEEGRRAVEVEVSPLCEDDARAAAEGMLGGREARLTPAQIARESGGNPYFLHELARYAVRSRDDAEGGVPSEPTLTLGGLLGARLERLPPAPRALAEVVALMGEPIAEGTAFAAAAIESGRHEVLAQLRAAGVLKRSAAAGIDRLELFHDRVRDAVLERLAPASLPARHRDLALALERGGEADPEAVARHFRAAGDVARAVEHTRRAAERASAALAFDRAVTLYRAALELAPTAERSVLSERLADALVNAGRGGEAAERYLAAVDGGDRRRDLDLRRRAAEHFLRSGRVDEGVATLEGVLADVGLTLPPTPRRALFSLLWARLSLWLRGLDHVTVAERDVDPDALLRLDACSAAALGLAMVDVVRSLDFQTRQLLLALSVGEPGRLSLALAVQAMRAATGGEKARPRVELMLAQARELSAQAPRPDVDAIVVGAEGVAAFIVGQWRTAHERLEEAERRMRERCVGVESYLTTVQLFSIASCFYLGELRELAERVPRYLQGAERRGDRYALVNFRVATGNLAWVLRDEPAEARRVAREALASWSQDGFLLQHWYALRSETQLDLYEGRGGEAHARFEAAFRPLSRSLITRAEHVFVETYAMRGRAALAAAAAEPRRARSLLAEAESDARRIEACNVRWALCLGLLLRAGASACRGDEGRAQTHLRAAVEACDAADMRLHAAAARVRLGQLLGGDGGREEAARGLAFMTEGGVRAPERMTEMLAPGFRRA